MNTNEEKFSHLLQLFIELDTWCQKHDIKLILDWGTLLGAVRHRGFIPWDFDLDVCATWSDYQKLLRIWDQDPIKNRELVNIDRYKDYPALFTRFVDITNTEIRKDSAWDLAPCGMSIDIFPLIPLPKKKKAKQKARDSLLVWYELKNEMMLNKRTREKSMRKLLGKSLILTKFLGREKVLKKLEKVIFATSESDCDEFQELTAGSRETCIVKKSILGSLRKIPFEGYLSYVPEYYIEHLQEAYGITWRIYPESKKPGYHYVENLNIPYQVYVDDYMQLINKDEVIRTAKQAKKVELLDVLLRPYISVDYYLINIESEIARLESLGEPSQFFNQAEFTAELESAIENFVKKILYSKYKYWAIWPKISDNWLKVICSYLFKKSDYRRLMSILNYRENFCEKPLPDFLIDFKKTIETLFGIYNAIDYNNEEMIRAALSKAAHINSTKTSAYIAGELAIYKIESNYSVMLSKAQDAYKIYSSDPYIQRFYAYALACNNDISTASKIYESLITKCQNGMVVLESKDDKRELGLDE